MILFQNRKFNLKVNNTFSGKLEDVHSEGITPLHISCINNDITLFSFLLDNDASMRINDENGFLPIHYAVIKDYVHFLK